MAVETGGVIGPQSIDFLRELSRKVEQVTGEPNSLGYLLQHISIAIQRGNAASILGSSGPVQLDAEDFIGAG